MRKFGLIGRHLEHSFSPAYFRNKFEKSGINDAVYDLYPIQEIGAVKNILDTGVSGLNVTIPYKESIIEYLDDLHPVARELGAVNTIAICAKQTMGYNTDVYGFEKSLLQSIGDMSLEKALILGTGGSSKAVAWVLRNLDIEYKLVSRSGKYLNYAELTREIIESHQLIINTTPLGMFPETEGYPDIPYRYLSEKHLSFDLIYNPEKTLFLKKSEAQNSKIQNGLPMLQYQAEKSWEIWTSSQDS